jgi:hypothetical protein
MQVYNEPQTQAKDNKQTDAVIKQSSEKTDDDKTIYASDIVNSSNRHSSHIGRLETKTGKGLLNWLLIQWTGM